MSSHDTNGNSVSQQTPRQRRKSIGVIGGGPAGICMLHAFSEHAKDYAGARFIVLDPRDEPYGGAAHSSDCASLRVNMRVELHTLRGSTPFPEYCKSLGWPDRKLPARWLLARYLESVFHHAKARLELAGGKVERIQAEATAIARNGEGYTISTRSGQMFDCEFIVLATGNPPPRMPAIAGRSEDPLSNGGISLYTGSPDFARDIRPGSRILVLGTGPGAVDVARYCVENIPTPFPVDMVSRGGRLSKVQTVNASSNRFDARMDGMVREFERRGTVTLREIASRFLPLFYEADPGLDLNAQLSTPTDPISCLRADIVAARRNGPKYREVLDSAGKCMPRIWGCLPDEEKKRFATEFERLFYVQRHAMPVEAGVWIVSAAARGKIRVGRISKDGLTEDGTCMGQRGFLGRVAFPGQEFEQSHYDHVAVATGPDYDLRQSRSELIRQILRDGIGTADPCGGFATRGFELRESRNVFATGAGVRGEYFSTHAIPALEEHARVNEAAIRDRLGK